MKVDFPIKCDYYNTNSEVVLARFISATWLSWLERQLQIRTVESGKGSSPALPSSFITTIYLLPYQFTL